jgi:ABC-2 type transport system permease protein
VTAPTIAGPDGYRRAMLVIWRVTAANLRVRMQYRTELLLAIVNGVIWQGSVLAFAGVILTRFPGLAGWPSGGVLLVAGMRLLSHGIYVAIFAAIPNVSELVQDGRFDGFLLRPMSVYRQALLSSFNINALGDLCVAVTLFTAALQMLDLNWTPVRVGYLCFGLVGAVFLEAAIQTVFGGAALRFPGVRVWSSWADEVMATFGNYPLSILPLVARAALTFVLPVAFLAYLPAAVLLDRVDGTGLPGWLVLASPAAGPVLFVLARQFWNQCVRHYQSPGG